MKEFMSKAIVWILLIMLVLPYTVFASASDDPGFPVEAGKDFTEYDGKLIGVSAGTYGTG